MIIISRCPYRISLLGGSSDLDWYVNQKGYGLSVGFSIKLFTRVIVSFRDYSDRGILNYSSREEYKDLESISHPIIRSCLKRFNLQKKIELCSMGESLSGSGLGSSSSFSVALVKAITKLNSLELDNNEIAHFASEIEINDLNKPIGRQDQYLCALGGVNLLEFKHNGEVKKYKESLLTEAIEDFSKNLYIVNTNINRSATSTLSDLKKDSRSISFIDDIRKITLDFIEKSRNLNKKDIKELLEIYIKNAWEVKRKMHGVMTQELSEIEAKIVKAEFSILKLLGAGGGGYFLTLFNGNSIEKSKSELEINGLNLIKVEICKEGCVSSNF